MSVDALMDSNLMSREMIERVGPRDALQPCDDPGYRELAQEFLEFAAECDEPITVIRLTGEKTIEVNSGLKGHIESGTQLAVYNSILALHLTGEAEISLDEFAEIVDLGDHEIDKARKSQLVFATITDLEELVPCATFYADVSKGNLHLERDIVVIDSRFFDVPVSVSAETEIITKTSEMVIVEEEAMVLDGIARQRRKRQPKFELEVEGVCMTFSQDELAILLYAISLQPFTKFRSSEVLSSAYWVSGERTIEDMRPAFSHAVTKLSAKLPNIFQSEGELSGRRYHLVDIPLLKHHADSDERRVVDSKLLMANFLRDFRDQRPLGIDNFSLATLQKLINGDFDRSLFLQPIKMSLMIDITEDIATRLLNYDLLAVDEAIIDRCYAALREVRNKQNALLLNEALEENERNSGSKINSAPVTSGSLKKDEKDYEWFDYGNCLGVDPDLFFPERGASTREAKEVCRGCEVRLDCLEHALQNGEKFGIWGGMSERERRRIRRQRSQAAKKAIN